MTMVKFIKVVMTLSLLFILPCKVNGEEVKKGYSPWSEQPTGDPNEISAIQYGRKVPIEWSSWNEENPSSFTKDYKEKEGEIRHYAFDGNKNSWNDVEAKSLYSWDFGHKTQVIYAYIDVDTYRSGTWDNYQGPPLQLYCDGKKIASTGVHHELENWQPSLNNSCRYMELTMSSSSGGGRDRTAIVGTWISSKSTLYSYVTKWSQGQDWRFEEPYKREYGENPQIPDERNVYSHPLTYHINYEIDGGDFIGEPVYSYTVNDEVYIPEAVKKGYDFLGFVDVNGNVVTKIEKGSTGDITLKAIYERKPPTIYVSFTYFDAEDRILPLDELIEKVNGKAKDELDGDISDRIKISKIVYYPSNVSIDNPSGLDISKPGYVDISFYVINSGNVKAEITRRYYILGKGEDIENYDSGIEIYARYIHEDFADSLNDKSIWRKDDYADVLRKAYKKYRED